MPELNSSLSGTDALLGALLGEMRALNQNVKATAPDPYTVSRLFNFQTPTPPDTIAAEDWQILPFDGQVAANGEIQVNRNIPRESHFDLVYITGRAVGHASGLGQTNLQIKIHDASSDRYLTEGGRWVHWENVIGTYPAGGVPATFLSTANAPYTIVGRRRFPVNSNVIIEVRDLAGVVTDFEICLHGIKVFAQYQK